MDRVRKFLFDAPCDTDGAGVRIGLIDTGIDEHHPDFASCICATRSTCGDTGVTDVVGHGTHVAGIICGDGAASKGEFCGIAPGASLLVAKAFHMENAKSGDIAAAVEWLLDEGVDIINFSGAHLGPADRVPWCRSPDLDVRDRAFILAASEGVFCVAAAGNHGPDEGTIGRPGDLRAVFTVGATSRDGEIWHESGRGPVWLDAALREGDVRQARINEEPSHHKPDAYAFGADSNGLWRVLINYFTSDPGIISTRSQSAHDRQSLIGRPYYGRWSGTSQATAVITGLAALALGYARQHYAAVRPDSILQFVMHPTETELMPRWSTVRDNVDRFFSH